MNNRALENLCGTVEHVIYQNQENGFAVIDLSYDGELINVVGTLGNVQEGEELSLMGYFSTHAVHGHQFKAETCEHQMPASATAICKYLGSGVVKGVGPATAKRTVDLFGEDTLTVIEKSPERLSEVKGITLKRALEMGEEFKQVFGVRTLMLFLSKYGVNPAHSVMIWKKWGVLAIDLIKENPYLLCARPFNVEFTVADAIAEEMGLERQSTARILAGVGYVLIHNLQNGHTCLPYDKLLQAGLQLLQLERNTVEDAIGELVQSGELVRIHKSKDYLSLPDLYEAERYIASRIALMVSVPPDEEPEIDFIIEQVEEQNKLQYDHLQRTAIRQALVNDIFILTGGPGTGKTTTLNGIIDVLEYRGKDIAIAAPTGRAAKRISEITGRESKTIHRMLEVEYQEGNVRFARNEQDPLRADAIVIDEMSMVDTMLFDALLRAAKPNCKLILVGDYNQLPSVGAGNVLQDLLESDIIPTVRLDRIFRQAEQSLIIRNAHQIVEGTMPELSDNANDFFFLARQTAESASQTIIDLVCRRLPKSYGFSAKEDIQVLCPQRKGETGVIELNRRLQNGINPDKTGHATFKSSLYTFHEGDKVMQTKNNYDIEWIKADEHGAGIFNGDIGIIQLIDRGSQTAAIDFEGRVAYYSFEMASEQLELAYAVTVHKSQGSEFEAVVMPIMGGYDRLYYRNLLYTAVTRAKKLLILIGRRDRIEYMVNNHIKSVRYTNLRYLLEDISGIT